MMADADLDRFIDIVEKIESATEDRLVALESAVAICADAIYAMRKDIKSVTDQIAGVE